MLRNLFIIVCFLFAATSCKQEKNTDPLSIKIAKEPAKKEIDLFSSILKKAHPSPFLYISEKKFNQLTDSVLQSIDEDISVKTLYNKLYFLVNKIGCSHTDIALPQYVYDTLQNREYFFPYPVEWIGKKLLVNVTGFNLTEGTEIRTVNGMPVKKILDDIMEYNVIEGRSRETQRKNASKDFSFNYFMRYSIPKIFTLEVTDTAGMEHTVREKPVSFSEWGNRNRESTYYYDDVSLDYDLSVNESKQYALLRLTTFEYLTVRKQQAFENFCMNTFDLLSRKPEIQHLIIDIRENPGGDLYNAALLFSYLAKAAFPQYGTVTARIQKIPFRSYLADDFSDGKETEINDYLKERFYKLTGATQFRYQDSFINKWRPDPTAFNRNVYVITNSKVTSSASYFALMVKNSGVGKIVGEETTGGSYSGNGFDFIRYKLPHSGILFYFPYAHIIYNYRDSVNTGSGVVPDYKIPATIEAFEGNTDNQVYFIVDSLISKNAITHLE